LVIGRWSLVRNWTRQRRLQEFRQNLDESEDEFRIAARIWAARNQKDDRRLCADEKPM
jgi:hypothetical protein